MRLYLVTDRRWLNERALKDDVEKAIQGGVTCVQLREKGTDEKTFIDLALSLKDVCHRYHVPLIINDNIDIMLKVDADGVHVGQKDMEATIARQKIGPDKILGVSASTKEQAIKAQEAGADYLGVGSVFSTQTKMDAHALNPQLLKEICLSVEIPVVAIGGINEENIELLKGTSIRGVSVVSAIMAKDDLKEAAHQLRMKVEDIVDDLSV